MSIRLTPKGIESIRASDQRQVFWDALVAGLSLRVMPSGKKTFSVWYRVNGRPRRYTLGRFPTVTLADARQQGKEILAAARRGEDVASGRIAARRSLDFEDLAGRFVEARAPNLAASTAKEYRRMISAYVQGSSIARTPIQALRRADIRDLLERRAKGSAVMANRLFQLVRAICRWAVREEILETNPCEGLQRPRKERSRERALKDHEIAALWNAADSVASQKGRPEIAGAVKLLLLLGQRSSETVEMRWADLDVSAKSWAIPGRYRKNERLHVVPLSALAMRLLGDLRPLTGNALRVLDGLSEANAERDWWGAVRDQALRVLAEDTGNKPERFSKHDLRRTCATGCARLGASPFIVSRILGHAAQVGAIAVTGIYDRYDRLPEMASALAAWSAHVERLVSGRRRKAAVHVMRRW